MKNKQMLLLAFILGLGYGCKKAEAKTYNPYSLEHMREAMSSLMMKDVQLLANNKQKYAHGKMMSTNSTAPLAINKTLTRKESLLL